MHTAYVARRISATLLFLAVAGRLVAAEGNMIGNQSQNEGLLAVPAPAAVTIDGDLAEWDTSGRIWVFADSGVRSRYSVEVSAMHDATNLYIALRWRDPTPMYSTVDPAIDPGSGWRSDSMQMRIDAGEQVSWLTTWYFTPKRQPVMHLARWKDPQGDRFGLEETLLTAQSGGTDLGKGTAMAYKVGADGASFTQEVRIPWSLITTKPQRAAGETFKVGFEFLWGDPTGKVFPIHRYADNMAPGETSREFYWADKNSWGNVELLDHGKLVPRSYVNQSFKPQGTMPLEAVVPASAARFTMVVEDSSGARVRNLVGDADPVDYLVEGKSSGDQRTVRASWDGLDDAGKLVAPGTYRVRGLWHQGLGASYEQCFYNPGTPPWPVQDGSGSWGSDHCEFRLAARAGDGMALAAVGAEGGEALIFIGADGKKKWGERRGANQLAADKDFIYLVTEGHMGESGKPGSNGFLIRLAVKDGAYARFVRGGSELPFQLQLETALGEQTISVLHDMVAGGGRLVVAFDDRIVAFDAATLERRGSWSLPGVTKVAIDHDGGILAWAAGALVHLDAAGKTTTIPLTGVGAVEDLTVDGDGAIVVLDGGADRQVKVFNREGALQSTRGVRGGRPLRGPWQAQGMRDASSVAVDATGKVWVTEASDLPRRVSVWGTDGALVRDYVGNTGYAGTGCFLHDQDPNLAYVGPVELTLDRANRSWRVSQILWRPDPAAGEGFAIPAREHAQPERFRSAAAGAAHEYLHTIPYRDEAGHVIYMEGPDHAWRPVAAITTAATVGDVTDAASPVKGLDPKQTLFWNDLNGDGKVQREECQLADKLSLGGGWGTRLDPATMTIYTNGIVAYKPVSFAADGAPRYGAAGMRRIGIDEHGDLVPVAGTDELLVLSFKGYAGPTRVLGVGTTDGAVRWTYPNPYPGVHGSHHATMPAPGLLLGPLKILGQVDVGGDVGGVFAMRGNLGQDFFMTTDGLMIGALFQDGRIPSAALPNTEAGLIGVPMEGFSNGGEPFNGWFGRQADGVARMLTGMPRQASMVLRINGLESIHRLPAQQLTVTPELLAAAEKANAERATAAVASTTYAVAKVAGRPDAAAWGKIAGVRIERAGLRDKALVQLAWDAATLYARWTVDDASPWLNQGKDATRLFKTGDAVDLQFGLTPVAEKKSDRQPQAGDARIVIGSLKSDKQGEASVVLMRPVDAAAAADAGVTYTSPVGAKRFASVTPLAVKATVGVKPGTGYVIEVALPMAILGIAPKPGLELSGDLGFILSDTAGTINSARLYWSDHDTNLVNDEPLEAWLRPGAWGTLKLQ